MIRLGTRGSTLARWQADWTAATLRSRGIDVEVVVISTSGDAVQNQSIVNIGAQGVFTKEIQQALLDGKIDLAVHSLKDLPTDLVDGLTLAAVPKRESYRDVFVSNIAASPEQLPENSRIGTGSLRRQTQWLYRYGNHCRLDDIRGNVETRLRKLDNGDYHAIILAEAGLKRLGFADRIRSFLYAPDFLPAVGQGALGLETRSNDAEVIKLVESISDKDTLTAVLAERAFLRTLQGGCSAPIAALGTVADRTLTLHGRVLSDDGKQCNDETQSAAATDNPESLGIAVAQVLLNGNAAVNTFCVKPPAPLVSEATLTRPDF
ncbi:porphobilinogen deaminase [Planctomycetales bacterium]|nr:porphobilinogen deaminase [Planctomycetales bacterium]